MESLTPLSSKLSSALTPLSSKVSSALTPLSSNVSGTPLSGTPLSEPARPMWQVALAVGVVGVVLYACYLYLWPPLAQMWNTPKLPPPAKKPAPPPAVKPEPTPNDTGFCYVGEWQGVRSCVEIKGGSCAGDLYPTAELCHDPNLRQ